MKTYPTPLDDPRKRHSLYRLLKERKELRRYVAFKVTSSFDQRVINVTAELEGVTVGSYKWEIKPRKLHSIYVPTELRGAGISRMLINHCVTQFGMPVTVKPEPFADGTLTVADLSAFYKRYGFRETSTGNMILDNTVALRRVETAKLRKK